ncbi:MAG: geranylgeranyl diphosphate synthase, type [Blastocatellia bacterium]|jgi:geranylgeranyl diphosphate synthase type II|nr:geranylgeranyl diphosphate synthase, type [Blastocatellia bacterium]
METLFEFIACQQERLDEALGEWLPVSSQPGAGRLNEALRYAVFPGGKRLRPIFTLLGASLVGAHPRQALASACAIEFLHNSSLILDDLPGMDDADLRRNRLALHLVYGEGVAVLASVALLNQAYALLVQSAADASGPGAVEALMKETARCIGADGMIGGQVVDLESGGADSYTERLYSRDLKTIALMRLMMVCGALARGADAPDIAALAKFGECLGRAYQICDDLLDELGDVHLTGKPLGQDARHLRPNIIAGMGLERAHRMGAQLIDEAKSALEERFGERREVRLLAEAADMVTGEVKRVGPMRRAKVAEEDTVSLR